MYQQERMTFDMDEPQQRATDLEAFRKPILREVAPGRYVPTDPTIAEMPEVLLCRLVPVEGGQFKLEPFREDWLRIGKAELASIGMARGVDTIRRLGKAGFIEVLAVSPGMQLLNLTSWYNHLRRVAQCAADGESFWEEGKGNIELYREIGGWM